MAELGQQAPAVVARKRVRWVVRVTALVVVSVFWLLAAMVTLGLLGLSGRTTGWAWCILALSPLVALTWVLVRPAGHRGVITVAAALVVVLLGLGMSRLGTPSLDRVIAVSQQLPVPADATVLSVDAFPNDWCLQYCTYVETLYAVDDAQASLAALAAGLDDEGWNRVQTWWCRGGFSVTATTVSVDGPRFKSQEPPPPGREAISVMTTARC